MNIPWKAKSAIFSAIDRFHAERLLYLMQKHLTGRSRRPLDAIHDNWRRHREFIEKYQADDVLFEFGAGKSLAQNLYLSEVVRRQIVVDLNPMLDVGYVERARQALLKLGVNLRSSDTISDRRALENYGIEYRAPYDARETDFENESVDVCVSTNTLEHVPRDSVVEIFLELYRILKRNGIVSAKVDYSDHYAHTDKSITLLNYLLFNEKEWRKFNHHCHYQNRLRHYDYQEIFAQCGFHIVEEEVMFEEPDIDERLKKKFESRPEVWSATAAHFVLQKRVG